jgi:hypothetical protein
MQVAICTSAVTGQAGHDAYARQCDDGAGAHCCGVGAAWLAVSQDEDRLQTATNEAPTLESFNRQLARNSAEFDLFQQMDREYEWPGELVAPQEVRRSALPWQQAAAEAAAKAAAANDMLFRQDYLPACLLHLKAGNWAVCIVYIGF